MTYTPLHQLQALPNPVDGMALATVIFQARGQDNVIAQTYNAHDADGSIHLGSGSTGSLPAENILAGTFGANVGGGAYTFPSTLGVDGELTITATTQSRIFLNTTTGATTDDTEIDFQRGGTIKWRIGSNVAGGNADAWQIVSEGVGTALGINKTTMAALWGGTLTASNLSGTNTGDQTTITGNAGSATKLQTARAINGVNFDGTAPITITAAAGTVTGTTLAANVVNASIATIGAVLNFVPPAGNTFNWVATAINSFQLNNVTTATTIAEFSSGGNLALLGNLNAVGLGGALTTASQPNVTTMAGLTTAGALVTVGALVSGSIAVGFGNINNASNSLTTGAITGTTTTLSGDMNVRSGNLTITALTGSLFSQGNVGCVNGGFDNPGATATWTAISTRVVDTGTIQRVQTITNAAILTLLGLASGRLLYVAN